MKPKQFFYVLLGVIAILILGGGGAYWLATKRLESKQAELRKNLADIEVANARVDQLSALSKELKKLEPILNQIEAALPPSKRQSEIILQIQRVAADAKMPLSALTFPNLTTLPGPATQTVRVGDSLAMPVSFTLSGSYENMLSFLRGMENLQRYSSISSIAVVKNDAPNNISFSVTLNVFLKP